MTVCSGAVSKFCSHFKYIYNCSTIHLVSVCNSDPVGTHADLYSEKKSVTDREQERERQERGRERWRDYN